MTVAKKSYDGVSLRKDKNLPPRDFFFRRVCSTCKQRKSVRGSSNGNNRFICADCRGDHGL